MSSICAYPSQGILPVDELANFKGMRSVDIKPIKAYGGEDTGVCLKAKLDVPDQMAKMWQHCTLDDGEIKYPESVVRNTFGACTHCHSYTHACMHACTHARTHAHTHTHTHTHTCMHIHTHTHMHAHTHTHTPHTPHTTITYSCTRIHTQRGMHVFTGPHARRHNTQHKHNTTTHITQEHIHMHT